MLDSECAAWLSTLDPTLGEAFWKLARLDQQLFDRGIEVRLNRAWESVHATLVRQRTSRAQKIRMPRNLAASTKGFVCLPMLEGSISVTGSAPVRSSVRRSHIA